jgi:hypothetical protein
MFHFDFIVFAAGCVTVDGDSNYDGVLDIVFSNSAIMHTYVFVCAVETSLDV